MIKDYMTKKYIEESQNESKIIIHQSKGNPCLATIGICGFKNIARTKHIISKIQTEDFLEKYKIKKILQLTFLSKNYGLLYGIIFIKGENLLDFFAALELPHFFTHIHFEKNLDSRNYVLLKKEVLIAL